MKTTKFKNQIFALLLICSFFTYCNGQTPPKQIGSTGKTAPLAKMVRTNRTLSEVVGCELLDKDGNLWFSINGEGAYRYDGKAFTHFTTKDGLCNNNIGAIIQDRAGNILLGTSNGICKYDGKTFTKYPVSDSRT